jgi:hypothetical protein
MQPKEIHEGESGITNSTTNCSENFAEADEITSMHVPQRWIGCATGDNMSLTCWPPQSPALHPVTFFLWGYVKDKVFIPPVPVTLDDVKQRIITATARVDEDMLTRVW